MEKLAVIEQTRFQRGATIVSNYFQPSFLLKSLNTEVRNRSQDRTSFVVFTLIVKNLLLCTGRLNELVATLQNVLY